MSARELNDLLLHPFKRRKHHFLNGVAKRKSMCDAVHVFRCEREVHPFENVLKARSFELKLDEILDGFYVVIGGRNSLIGPFGSKKRPTDRKRSYSLLNPFIEYWRKAFLLRAEPTSARRRSIAFRGFSPIRRTA
jgi:hypothetical protein